MNYNYNILLNKFNNIKNNGWVKSMRGGITGSGYTFETLIGKKEDDFFLPDFNGIEIKTINEKSRYNLSLFGAMPDGDYLFPLKKVYDRLAYPSKKNPNVKILNVQANAKEFTNIGYYKKIKLKVDRANKKIRLIAMRDNRDINAFVSWSFELLEQRLLLKLKNLAIVTTKSKKINDDYYFFFYKIDFYEFTNFNTFIKLVEDGKICINIQISAYITENKLGEMKNKGTTFTIKKEAIDELFKKIDI